MACIIRSRENCKNNINVYFYKYILKNYYEQAARERAEYDRILRDYKKTDAYKQFQSNW